MKTTLLISIILLWGCSPKYYAPNSQNIPIMKSKGQTNLGIFYNESEYTRGFELQAAHAISNHIALQFNTDWIKNGKNGFLNDASEDLKAKGSMIEIGAGYFTDVARNFTFETYGLVCFGKIDSEDLSLSNSIDVSAKFNRIGIQPSLSYSRKHYSISVSSRIVHLKYKDIYTSGNSEYFDPNYLKSNDAHWLLEPALSFQIGSENLKFQFQYVYSSNLTTPSFEQEPDIVSFGIKLKIDPKK